jgi:hypothetical protein
MGERPRRHPPLPLALPLAIPWTPGRAPGDEVGALVGVEGGEFRCCCQAALLPGCVAFRPILSLWALVIIRQVPAHHALLA